MSTNTVPRNSNDFRAASGLASWATIDGDPGEPESSHGPGLFEVTRGGERMLTNVRKIAGCAREPRKAGSVLIALATWLLGVVGAGALFVSFAGQLRYVLAERGQLTSSLVESGLLDTAMLVLTLLAIGLARAGKPAKVTRLLIVAFAASSAAMNLGPANLGSPRSVAVWVAPPVILAVVVDQVVVTIRRHYLNIDEPSVWAVAGHALVATVKAFAVVLLYTLRLVLAPRSTTTGLRYWVLALAPLPATAAPQRGDEEEITEPDELAGATKRARLAWWYSQDPDYGNRSAVAAAAKRLAPRVGLGEGTARAYLGQIVAGLEAGDES